MKGPESGERVRRLDVLVVVEDPAVAGVVCAALRRRGHEVLIAARADEALALSAPEALVCDALLEGGGGLELIEALHGRGAFPHAVLLAAQPNLEECRRAMRLGVADLIPRPFALDELVAAVERAPRKSTAAAPDSRNRFERGYPSTRGCVERAARDLSAFCLRAGLGPATRGRVASACAEILENARLHAYGDAVGAIRVSAERRADDLLVSIADRGAGFDAVGAQLDGVMLDAVPGPLPRPYAGSPAQGGIARVASLAEDLRFESSPAGTTVDLRFEALPTSFEEERGVDFSDLDYLDPETSRRVLQSVAEGQTADLIGISPALAVTIGRLLAGRTPSQTAQSALWS